MFDIYEATRQQDFQPNCWAYIQNAPSAQKMPASADHWQTEADCKTEIAEVTNGNEDEAFLPIVFGITHLQQHVLGSNTEVANTTQVGSWI